MDILSDKEKYPNLRRAVARGRGVGEWSFDNLKDGFQYFFDLYARYPTAMEVDSFSFLPSARSIQRSFGGLEALRSKLGLSDIHFGKGKFRSKIAFRVNKRGRQSEIELESALRSQFGEMFVHTERFINKDTKCRVDFFVFSPDGNFAVDVFYPDTFFTFMRNINSKEKKYKFAGGVDLYLVVANPNIEQTEIERYKLAKKNQLAANIQIVGLGVFFDAIRSKRKYLIVT